MMLKLNWSLNATRKFYLVPLQMFFHPYKSSKIPILPLSFNLLNMNFSPLTFNIFQFNEFTPTFSKHFRLVFLFLSKIIVIKHFQIQANFRNTRVTGIYTGSLYKSFPNSSHGLIIKR